MVIICNQESVCVVPARGFSDNVSAGFPHIHIPLGEALNLTLDVSVLVYVCHLVDR